MLLALPLHNKEVSSKILYIMIILKTTNFCSDVLCEYENEKKDYIFPSREFFIIKYIFIIYFLLNLLFLFNTIFIIYFREI